MSSTDSPSGGQESISAPGQDNKSPAEFLEFFFEGLTGYLEIGYFTAGSKPKRTGHPEFVELPLSEEQVVNDILKLKWQRMTAFGVAPRYRVPERRRPGTEREIIQVGCVWINLDYRSTAGGPIEVVRRIHSFPLRPSVAINSGYGHHLYFLFRDPLGAEKLVEWLNLMRGLRTALGVNDEISLSQVMRLPGSLNLREKQALPCQVWGEYSSWGRYTTEEVRSAIESALSESVSTPLPAPGPGHTFAASKAASLAALRSRGVDDGLAEVILTGKINARSRGQGLYAGEPGRDFWVASRLYELHFSPEEIKAVFRAHPGGCGRTWSKRRDGERYLGAVVSNVEERYRDLKGISTSGGGADSDSFNSTDKLPSGYVRSDDGSVWFAPPVNDNDRKVAKPVKVSSSTIRIAEIHENIDTGQISLSIAFDYLGQERVARVPRSQISNSRHLASVLAGAGAPVSTNNARQVISYLSAYEEEFAPSIRRIRVTSRFGRGRNGGTFFFPGLFTSTEFLPLSTGDASLYRAYASRAGSLRNWLEVTRLLYRESLMIPQVAIIASLVSPLQRRLQIPNFILDIYGNTSTGKSTSLKLAASVYGRPYDPDSLVQQWMNTQLAIEQTASMCSELPIFLDDAQHCPVELKRSVIYMIANGKGRGRAARAGGLVEAPTWHTVALSTSEEPLHEVSPHEGARGRILSVGGLTPPFQAGKAGLVQELEKEVSLNHGYAGEAFIRHINGWGDADWDRWRVRFFAVRSELLKSTSSNIVGRVSGYIAAIQVAAEAACPLLGLPFQPDVLSAWLMLHLNEQESDRNVVLTALRALADHFLANLGAFAGDGRFVEGKRTPLQGVARRHHYVAFLRSTLEAVCRPRKWNSTALLNKMAAAGMLLATESDRHTRKVGFDGVKHRMVCIKWSAILPDDLTMSNNNDERLSAFESDGGVPSTNLPD